MDLEEFLTQKYIAELDLNKRMGFRSQKPDALTNAERQARWRAKHGSRMIRTDLPADTAAAMLYLRKQWGFKSHRELVNAAIRYLAIQTRKGLQRIDLEID